MVEKDDDPSHFLKEQLLPKQEQSIFHNLIKNFQLLAILDYNFSALNQNSLLVFGQSTNPQDQNQALKSPQFRQSDQTNYEQVGDQFTQQKGVSRKKLSDQYKTNPGAPQQKRRDLQNVIDPHNFDSQNSDMQFESKNINRNLVVEDINQDVYQTNKGSGNKETLIRFEDLNESQHSFSDEERYLFKLVTNNKHEQLNEFLKDNPAINITKLFDGQGYTLLHLATYKDSLKSVKILCDHILNHSLIPNRDDRKKLLQGWIGLQTQSEEGFTALHFASYYGNMPLIRFLIDNGASDQAVNKHRINMLHVSAQGDQPAALAFYKIKGIDIDSRDSKYSTPLHWACFSGADASISFLLAWNADVNAQDQNGLTPLHLAIKQADDTKSTRAIRHLLVKGANRNQEDKLGRTPLTIAKEIRDPEFRDQIISFLEEKNNCQCFMVKTPLKRIKKSRATVIMYLFLILFSYAVSWLYFNIEIHMPYTLDKAIHILFGLQLFFFLISWQRDPGYLKQDKSINFSTTIEKIQHHYLCPDCEVIRTDRSRHCNICNRCVDRFDHHCPWINNCIGVNNHAYFYMYVVFTTAYIFATIYLNLIVIWHGIFQGEYMHEDPLIPFGNYEFREFIQDVIDDYNQEIILSLALFMVGLGLFFLFPLIVLGFVQTKNLLTNQTTSERFSNRRPSTHQNKQLANGQQSQTDSNAIKSSSQTSSETFNRRRGFLISNIANCYDMCCTSQRDTQIMLLEKRRISIPTSYDKP
ncbi:dhhc zinc finger domain containing protein [Stylonychia lemnae]|uniref:Palmitoyltransferase n=1 Tax=Stylonychia lemnae TaxID=5949 RepID=A0A077ZZK2_STYLE|nr:dhhc zinc finger domain containing protein [Stylonychia lemnae]|eukprot:CDW75351.1 dhhc zinc finger domain containing protein [Stylonychia lemnae]